MPLMPISLNCPGVRHINTDGVNFVCIITKIYYFILINCFISQIIHLKEFV